jgi:sRNA-binding regulator protein Hfq/ribosomal protein L20A (L18A)
MSSSEAFNFGRKIKDLKRNYNKTYAELTSGLKISRERIIQLEENEREPTEVERRRFADFYNQPPEDLGLIGGPSGGIPAPRSPAAPPRPTPGNYAPPPTPGLERPPYVPPQAGFGNQGNFPERGGYSPERNSYGGYDNRPTGGPRFDPNERRPQGGYDQGQGGYDRGNYEPRPPGGGYDNRGNYDRGNFEPRPSGNNFQDRPPRGPGNFQDRPPRGPGNFQDRPQRGPGNFQDRPPRGPGNFQDRPQRAPGGRGSDENERPSKPAPKAPKPRGEKPANTGEPKPVMKYTAEQLGDIESAYLRKQRDLKVPLKFTFMNGKEYTGVVTDFTPFTVHILDQTTGEEVILRKLAMAYYRKADAVEEARNSAQAGNGNKVEEV